MIRFKKGVKERNTMPTNLENLRYRTEWTDCTVDYYEGYRSTMADFHMHDYYEVSLILTGSVKVLLSDHVQEGEGARFVLSAPKTPHFISRDPDVFYSRLNLLFSHDFLDGYVPEATHLLSVFGKHGRVITLSEEDRELFRTLLCDVSEETDLFRRRLKVLCILSHIAERCREEPVDPDIPPCVTGALTYIGEHYAEKILAAELAWHLGVGRTTLMTAFKAYTGSTLNDHVIRCRVKNATHLLRAGATEQEAADACGFGDTCGLIRGFRKCYGMTPRQYLLSESERRASAQRS